MKLKEHGGNAAARTHTGYTANDLRLHWGGQAVRTLESRTVGSPIKESRGGATGRGGGAMGFAAPALARLGSWFRKGSSDQLQRPGDRPAAGSTKTKWKKKKGGLSEADRSRSYEELATPEKRKMQASLMGPRSSSYTSGTGAVPFHLPP